MGDVWLKLSPRQTWARLVVAGPQCQRMGRRAEGLASLEHLPWASLVPGFSEHLLQQCFLHPGWEAGQALICRWESPGLGSLLALLPGIARFLSSQDPEGPAWSLAEGRWAWVAEGGVFSLCS